MDFTACVNERCKRQRVCPYCGAYNGTVKKTTGALKIIHDKYAKNASLLDKYKEGLSEAMKYNDLIKHFAGSIADDLNPLRVQFLFEHIPEQDCDVLDMVGRPEHLVVTHLAVPPVAIRPSVEMDGASNEDDITMKLMQIVETNNVLHQSLDCGLPVNNLMENWDFLQVCVPQHMAVVLTYPERVTAYNIEKLRRCVLNGVGTHPGANFVILPSGDKMFLKFGDRRKMAAELKVGYVVERHLEDGDVVLFNRQPSLHRLSIQAFRARVRTYRTLRFNECCCGPFNADFDGDEMNLHLPQTEESEEARAEALYLMGSVSNTEEARAEAIYLMGNVSNLCTPKNGELVIHATQDFLTCAFLLTEKVGGLGFRVQNLGQGVKSPNLKPGERVIRATQDFLTCAFLLAEKDRFMTRSEFSFLCSHMSDAMEAVDVPPPAILKRAHTAWLRSKSAAAKREHNRANRAADAAVQRDRERWIGQQVAEAQHMLRKKNLRQFAQACDRLAGRSRSHQIPPTMRDVSGALHSGPDGVLKAMTESFDKLYGGETKLSDETLNQLENDVAAFELTRATEVDEAHGRPPDLTETEACVRALRSAAAPGG
ncbi:hypothetical protein FOA52_011666 [Chlamydomonas sp. UWO 241]|nr:hypothetical protein FOA52_011666 [Chlamydomonas sp. UWO 241]